MQKKYAVVIVTFQPDIQRVTGNVRELRRQGFFVIIVDNFSGNIKDIYSFLNFLHNYLFIKIGILSL